MHGWHEVPKLVGELVKEGSTMFARLRAAMKTLPQAQPGYGHVWFNPRTQAVYFSLGDSDENDMYKDWEEGLKVQGVKSVTGDAETPPRKEHGPWLRVKTAALTDIFGPIAQAGGWKEGFPANFMGGPSPFSAMVASGALGAGAGYGTGWLAEQLLPERYVQPGKLRRNLAMAGGMLGAVPGFWTATDNLRHGAGMFDPFGASGEADNKQASAIRHLADMLDVFSEADSITRREMDKAAQAFESGGASPYIKSIEKDRFNRALWNDPFTPDYLKGMTSGVLEGANQVGGGGGLVSPMDIAQLGIGMGSGLASGLIVGKTLGALAGISPLAQEGLQRAGIWAGAIKTIVPKLYTRSANDYTEFYG